MRILPTHMQSVRLLSSIVTVLLSLGAHAAPLSILFRSHDSSGSPPGLRGVPGNLAFNGEYFVTPTVQSNGGIHLVFVNSNAVIASNLTLSLSITGSSPRLV